MSLQIQGNISKSIKFKEDRWNRFVKPVSLFRDILNYLPQLIITMFIFFILKLLQVSNVESL